MGTPVFGISVGDIITGIKFANDIYKACKEQGGANSKSEAVLRELDVYCKVLENLEEDSKHWASSGRAQDVCELLSLCQRPLKEFHDKLSKRWSNDVDMIPAPNFLEYASKNFKSFRRKAKWALSDVKKVEQLRVQIGPSMALLGRLIEVDTRSLTHFYIARAIIDQV